MKVHILYFHNPCGNRQVNKGRFRASSYWAWGRWSSRFIWNEEIAGSSPAAQTKTYRSGVMVTQRLPNPKIGVRFLRPVPTLARSSIGKATGFEPVKWGSIPHCAAINYN